MLNKKFFILIFLATVFYGLPGRASCKIFKVPKLFSLHQQHNAIQAEDALKTKLVFSKSQYDTFFLQNCMPLLPLIYFTGNAVVLDVYQQEPNSSAKHSDLSFGEAITQFFSSKKSENALKFNQLAVILSVLLVTILLLFTLLLYKNNNIRGRANVLLQEKNDELRKAKERAEAASKAKEQFLSNISHELRTPIYAITGLTYLLLNENPNAQQQEHLNSLKYSGAHLLALINNILDLNKLEAHKVKLVKTNFNLKKHMDNLLGSLKQTAKNNHVDLHLEIGENVPFQLYGDMLKVSQVLMNLMSNAIKFTENGDVWIRIRKVEEGNKKVKLCFEVEDNGQGIPKNKQKAIFRNFEQGSATINVSHGGTGLGLPIVKNLLKFLGSEIHLESEPKKGSLFSFEINFKKGKTQAQKKLKPAFSQASKEEQDEIFKGKKVLVVDDNKLNQKITQRILEKRAVICEVAENGKKAIALATNNSYHAILMDIHMPEMDGIEATKIIRRMDKTTPIIALTAVSIDEEINEFLKNGFTEFIPKPYKTELFFEKIYTILKTTPVEIE